MDSEAGALCQETKGLGRDKDVEKDKRLDLSLLLEQNYARVLRLVTFCKARAYFSRLRGLCLSEMVQLSATEFQILQQMRQSC